MSHRAVCEVPCAIFYCLAKRLEDKWWPKVYSDWPPTEMSFPLTCPLVLKLSSVPAVHHEIGGKMYHTR